MEQSKKCHLCKSIPSNEKLIINFSCKHVICVSCLPYLIFNLINEGPLLHEIKQCPCLVCGKGKTLITLDEILNLHPMALDSTPVAPLCGECKTQNSTYFCYMCQKHYCLKCFSFHSGKFFQKHVVVTLEEMKEILNLHCDCSENKQAIFFCKECKIAICSNCLEKDHQNHETMKLDEIDHQSENLIDKKKILQQIREDLKTFHTDTLKSFKENIDDYDKEFSEWIEAITKSLKEIQKKNMEQAICSYQVLDDKFNLIEKCLYDLSEDLGKIDGLNPTKVFYMNNFFLEEENSCLSLPDIQIERNDMLENLKITLNRILSKEITLPLRLSFKFLEQEQVLKAFSRKPDVLEKRSFYAYGWKKSGISAIFKFEKEAYLVTPLSKNQEFYPMQILNLKNKQKQIFKGSGNYISAISAFFDENLQKNWIIVGDAGGVLKIFDVGKKPFKEIKALKLVNGKGIACVEAFRDKFSEIYNDSDKNVYGVVAFLESCEFFGIYDLENGSLARLIENSGSNLCLSLNYFHDENKENTLLFFGCAKGFVKLYELKSKKLTNSFPVTSPVTSLQYFTANKIIYSQRNSNTITIANIETEKIFRKEQISDFSEIYDVCLCNELIIVAGLSNNQKGCLKVLDSRLRVLITREGDLAYEIPINIKKLEKGFVVCSYGGECSTSILDFEEHIDLEDLEEI